VSAIPNQLYAATPQVNEQAERFVRWLRAIAVMGDPAAVKRVCVERNIPFADHDLEGLRGELLKLAAEHAKGLSV
jgi:hypothetical protein